MERVFKSLSGHPMEMSDEDRILCIMMDVKYRRTSDLEGNLIVGTTAFDIRAALREEGFKIVRNDS